MPLEIKAQEGPPIEVFLPETYGAEIQNWSISQSKEKYIYVANSEGLLEFNGAVWTLYPSPNETIMRSVYVIEDRIYSGCYREFGYWKKNEFGELVYTSLSHELNIDFLEDEEIWNISALDNWILFQSLKRIYIYNKKDSSYTIIDSETTLWKIFKVDKSIYFQKAKDGLYKIDKGISKLISSGPVIRDNLLVNVFNHRDKLLLETQNNGFFNLDSTGIIKWDVPGNEYLSNISVYNSIQLKDKSFVLGTISNGILRLSPNGELNYEMDQSNGLSNNTVLSLFEDMEGNIWLGLDNGINCININSPFSIYNDKNGKLGTIYASTIFNNYLYLGTNQGLFSKPLDDKGNFTFVEGTQGQVWCLVVLDDTLFCGHNSGTFVINNNKAELVNNIEGTWGIKQISSLDNKILQGNYDGLYVMERHNGKWHFKNKIEGFDVSSRFFEIYNNTEIFISHEYKGVFKIKVDPDFTKALEVTKDSTIPKELTAGLLKYNNDLLYTYKQGIFKYDQARKGFRKDSLLSTAFSKEEYISGKLVADNITNKLWVFTTKNLRYIEPGKLSGLPQINEISLFKTNRKAKKGYENIYHLNDQKYLIGMTTGYIILDLDKLREKEYNITINGIVNKTTHGTSSLQDKSVEGHFEYRNNNIDFSFSVQEFEKFTNIEYQYQLEGIYNDWGSWFSEPYVFFKNLPYGEYTFNVKAKVGNKITNNIASYSFEIKRPLLFSNVFIFIYGFIVLTFLFLIHNIYKRYYRKQREKILEKTTKELELKKMENQQQLMRFKNEKLRQDIENKNRELAISTMSLIKKNEFLHNIKKDLKNTDDVKNLKYVIKIIDRNLNNTDDWQLFEEAFNNADKDFLKKIKTDHPSLTSNDLRLCAYLRLNLSSKEIAPLLNISARSVEVKRYRLRKKLGLSHESSLSDYILEI